jgi:sporulation protein YlmC with PRC-barrel domain
MSRLVPLERYVGKPVRDPDGKKLGHLHDVRVRREGNELVVEQYVVGGAGLLERFSLLELAREVGYIFGPRRAGGYLVPWDALEFAEKGKLRCSRRADELERFSAEPRAER